MKNGNAPVNAVIDPFGQALPLFGLSKREHFAGLALQGMVAVCSYDEQKAAKCRAAVEFADALLKELDK